MLGCRQVGKAADFGSAIRGFESFRPSQFFADTSGARRFRTRVASATVTKL